MRSLAARWAMIRATASRQLWSSLSTWERKPQMVTVFAEDAEDAGLGQDISEG